MSTVKGFYDKEGNIIPYDYRYLANSPTKLSNFTNDLFGEQREVVQEITKDSFVYDEVLQAYTFFIDSALTWLVVDENVSKVLGCDLLKYNSEASAYELVTEENSPFVVGSDKVITFENFRLFNGLRPSVTGEYAEVDEFWVVCDNIDFGDEGYFSISHKYTKSLSNMEVFAITISDVTDEGENIIGYSSDKTFEEIKDAIESKKVLFCDYHGIVSYLESYWIDDSRMDCLFKGITNYQGEISISYSDSTLTISVIDNDSVLPLSSTSVSGRVLGVSEHGNPQWVNIKPTTTTITLETSKWDSSSKTYSLESTYPNASYDIEIDFDYDNGTTEQYEAYCEAQLGGSASSNVLKAMGEVPTIDIPVVVYATAKNWR